MRSNVLRLLGGSLPRDGFSATGELSREGSGYTLVLETSIDGQPGVRRMHDASCEELARAAAAVIALAIDPTLELPPAGTADEEPAETRVVKEAPSAASEASTPKSAKQPPAATPVPPRRRDASRAPAASVFEIDALLAAVGESGTVPGFSPGGMLLVEARTGNALFSAGAEYLFPQRTTLADSGVGAVVAYLGFRAIGCVGAFAQRLAPAGCAGLGVGRLTGESRGASTPGSGSMRWITPELGGLLRYRASERVFLQGGATLRIALEDSEFTIDNVGRVYSPDWVALALHAGVAVRIW